MKCIKITQNGITKVARISDKEARELVRADPENIVFVPKKIWKNATIKETKK